LQAYRKKLKGVNVMARMINNEEYYSLPEVSDLIKVSHMTVYRWARKGMAKNGYQLKVVQDSLTGQYYIATQSVRPLVDRFDPKNRFQVKFDPQSIVPSH
jgi:transposase